MLPYWIDESVQLSLILLPLLCVIRVLLIRFGTACARRYHEWREAQPEAGLKRAGSSTQFEDFKGKTSESWQHHRPLSLPGTGTVLFANASLDSPFIPLLTPLLAPSRYSQKMRQRDRDEEAKIKGRGAKV